MPASGASFFSTLISNRSLLWQLVRRDFHQRYVGSAAGWLWGIVHPAVLLACWTFMFDYLLGQGQSITVRGTITEHYTLYLLAGYLPWFLFQETVQRCSNSLLDQASIITKTVFPTEIIAVSLFLSTLVNHLFTLVLTLVAVLIWTHTLPWQIVALPLFMLLNGMLAVGLGWIASSFQVYLRDTAQAVQVLLTLWFWLTPIFVDEEKYPQSIRFLITWNPVALFVRSYRQMLLAARLPSLQDIGLLVLQCGTVFLIGGIIFRQLRRGFADVL
jgi:lipopolysaccharide transport system permease protein